MSIIRSSFREQQQPNNNFKQELKKYSFCVMVDPLSGLGCGKSFLKLETQKICFMLDNDSEEPRSSDKQKKMKFDIHVHFCDMNNEKSLEGAFENLKNSNTERSRKNRIIVCGDQSSIGYLIKKAQKYNINIDNVPIGIIPSGRTNDLSNILGWGQVENDDLIGTQLKCIKELVRKWIKAIIEKIDVWYVQIEVNEQDGEIEKVNKNSKLKVNQTQKIISQYMISHFNIGLQARIALGFDQKKSNQSNLANKFIYAFEGFKKLMCMSPVKVEKMISQVEISTTTSKGDQKVFKTLFSSKKQQMQRQPDDNHQRKYLTGSPVSLACLNINCYRGITNVWKQAKPSQENENSIQSYYDGKLQFVTFSSLFSSQANRICQAEGNNIRIKMQRHHPAYLQIDDVSYKLNSPKQIRVLKSMKLLILINKDSLI